MVKISVVMPVYNGANQLLASIESILGQTHTDLEMIVVDDGSTDETQAVLASLCRRDSRLRSIRVPHAGITRALIRGCAEAQATLIARQDCGDRSRTARLATQYALMQDRSIVLSSCGATFRAPSGERLYDSVLDGEKVHQSLLRDPAESIAGPPHHGAVMFRREDYLAVGGYRSAFYFAQDIDLWIRLAGRGRIAIAPEILYDAFLDYGAISSRHRREQIASVRIAAAIRDGGPPEELLERATQIRPSHSSDRNRKRESEALYFVASCLRRNGDPAWKRYVRDSLRTNPWQVRGWLLTLRFP